MTAPPTKTETWWVICPLQSLVVGVCDSEDEALDLVIVCEQFAPPPRHRSYSVLGPLKRHTIRDPATRTAVGYVMLTT